MEIFGNIFAKNREETPPEAISVRTVRKLPPDSTEKLTEGTSLVSTSPQGQGHLPARDVWYAWKPMYYC
jgi:hypothetical protein